MRLVTGMWDIKGSVDPFIAFFGNTLTVRFLRVTSYTIDAKTKHVPTSITLSCCPFRFIVG